MIYREMSFCRYWILGLVFLGVLVSFGSSRISDPEEITSRKWDPLKLLSRNVTLAPSPRLIVEMHPECTHSELESHMLRHAADTLTVHHRYSTLFHGISVSGISERDLRSHFGVLEVHRDTKKHITAYSWGLDRIDQLNLPLSGTYSPAYHGIGVDVYVVDTGIDTTHVEFTPDSFDREVANIYSFDGKVTANADDEGHGTHVAGTVGGNTIGVAPGASIFGVKVMGADGSGGKVARAAL